MKILTSLPSNKDFFDTYAPLSGKIIWAGIFAQVVSGLTELGIIYTGCKQALSPLNLGAWEHLISAAVAIIGTATIEVGLRQTFPKAIDSILHARWKGLHLPISIFVWLLSIALMATSGILSFKNSKVIVENFTPEAESQTNHLADSIYQVEQTGFGTSFKQDSLLIEKTFKSKIDVTTVSFDKKIDSQERAIVGYENKEARTNRSYATRKDNVRQNIADLEAAKADTLAILEMNKANQLMALNTNTQTALSQAKNNHLKAVTRVVNSNKQAETDRNNLVNNYGGGLGWFTVVCLFLFSVSVILNRIYRKGAGIEEKVQIEAYDFRPSALREWWSSIQERTNYLLHNKVKSFADATPPAPLPVQPGVLYDLTETMQHVTIQLQLNTNEDGNNVIVLDTKQPGIERFTQHRQIGFQMQNKSNISSDLYSPRTTNHETTKKDAKNSFETVDLRQAKQRLKRYKKRLGGQQQKAIKQQQATGKVLKRTAHAIKNNEQWVAYWEDVINTLTNG
ncbi:MAG: hypothetical protein KDC85_12960 [Saprospiraceae bacterium]|nr:hypothetical protein [Saprospiraceae bacterium]MCB9324003.1 hypothetical protein [Lewinellaceae bacterium]